MRWTERQRAMLAEMGLVLPPAACVDDEPEMAVAASAEAAPPREESHARPASAPAARMPPPAAPAVPAAPIALGPRPIGVERMDWPALREAVVACSACGLCRGRRQTVFGVGSTQAHWMVVGEAPGEQEDIQGEPFVGKSGQLLDNMLRAIGLTRDEGGVDPAKQVYIANTLKCRPPGNRNPSPEELAQCEPFLLRQVELLRPKIILAMGRFAVQSLLRSSEPVGRLRGRVHRYHGVPLVVTYHPAYLLRNLDDKARAWDDLCLALDVVEQAGAAAGV